MASKLSNEKYFPLPDGSYFQPLEHQRDIQPWLQAGRPGDRSLKPDLTLLEAEPEDEYLVDVADLLPSDAGFTELPIEVPNFAFEPDHWSAAFLQGLAKLDVEGKRALEIGVGTGVNAIYLLQRGVREILLADLNPECVVLACRNIVRHVKGKIGRVKPFRYSLDLLEGSWLDHIATHRRPAPNKFDLIYACIPQVELPKGLALADSDNLAHYYDPGRYRNDEFSADGLTLNATLLQQAHRHLTYSGGIVLNLCGRPGQGRLEELFDRSGYESELLYSTTIPQHAGTSLVTLAQLEAAQTGRSFEFFADPDGSEQINASEAERRRVAGEPVYHNIYVYRGTPNRRDWVYHSTVG